MEYRALGKYKVSRLGLGTVQFGLDYGFTKKLSEKEVGRVLEACSEQGVNFLDTARDYGDSENKIGAYCRRHPSSDFVIATKISVIPPEACRSQKLLENHVRRSIDASRRALRRDRLQILQLHNTHDYVVKSKRFWGLMRRLREEKLFELFGVSFYEPKAAGFCLKKHSDLIRVVQAPFSIADKRFSKVCGIVTRNKAFFIARSIFLRGLIVSDKSSIPPELSGFIPMAEQLDLFSKESGLSKSQAALLFVYDKACIDVALVGVKSAAELLANVRALDGLATFGRFRARIDSLEFHDDAILDPRKWRRNHDKAKAVSAGRRALCSRRSIPKYGAGKIVAIIQARMGSSRLPGKVLKNLAGKPMLLQLIERARRSRYVDQWVVATTTDPLDDRIEKLCRKQHIPFYRGSVRDVLDRYFRCAQLYQADHVVRVTGDCPVIDPVIIDKVVDFYKKNRFDYAACNRLSNTLPDGLDVEVFSFANLEKAHREAVLPSEREHVTPFFYKHPEKFKLGDFRNETDLSGHRWTVDEPDDFEFISEVYRALYRQKRFFSMKDILDFLKKRPDVMKINSGHRWNEGYEKSLKNNVLFSKGTS